METVYYLEKITSRKLIADEITKAIDDYYELKLISNKDLL